MLWQEESLFTASLHISDFVQTQNEAKILIRVSKIHRQKHSKIQNNRKLEKSLQMAQKRGAKILQVPNPADPLKSSNGDKTV
jgi:hypothetical protein